LERAEVHADGAGDAQGLAGLHGLGWVHVDGLHDVSGRVGADGQQGEAGRAEASAYRRPMRPGAAVPGEQHLAGVRPHHEPGPQRPVPVEHAAGGEVAGRGGRDRDGADAGLAPPIQLLRARDAGLGQQGGVAQGGDDGGGEAGVQGLQAGEVHVVVVVVRHQHGVDARQGVQRQPGRPGALGAEVPQGGAALAEHRVSDEGEHLAARQRQADQEGAVADEGERGMAGGDRVRRGRLRRVLHPVGPGRAPPGERPAQDGAHAAVPDPAGVVEVLAVEMVG